MAEIAELEAPQVEDQQDGQQQQGGDPVETYYNYLKKAGADVAPTLESFKNTLSDPNTAQKYYNYLKTNHFDAPDTYDSFAGTLGLKKNEPSPSFGKYTPSLPKEATDNLPTSTAPVPKVDLNVTTAGQLAKKQQQANETLHSELTGNNDIIPGVIQKQKQNNQFTQGTADFTSKPLSDQPLTQTQQISNSLSPKEQPLAVSPEEVDAFSQLAQTDPDAGKGFLAQVAKAKPEKSAAIQEALYVNDSQGRLQQDPNKGNKILQNAQKIAKGDLVYGIQNGALQKPEDTWQSIGTGIKNKTKAFNDYDFFSDANPQDAAAELEKRRQAFDPDEPTPVPKGFVPELAGGMASQPFRGMALGKVTGGIMAVTPGAEEFAPVVNKLVTTAVSGNDYRKMSYVNSLQQNYNDLRNQGLPAADAYEKANTAAKQQSLVDAAAGAAMIYVGGKIGETPLPKFSLSEGFKNAVVSGLKQVANGVGEAGAMGLIQGAAQQEKNELAEKQGIHTDTTGKDIEEAMTSGALFTLGIAAIAKGMEGMSGSTKSKILQGLSKADPQQVDAELGHQILETHITPEEAVATKEAIDEHRTMDASIPDNVTDESRLKIQDKIKRRDYLQTQIESSDPAFHPEIKDKIKQINEDILELAKDKNPRGQQEILSPNTESNEKTNDEAQAGQVKSESAGDITDQGAALSTKPISENIHTTPDLRTWDLGDMEGKPEDEAAKKHIEGVVQEWNKKPATDATESEKQGETFGEFTQRVIPAFEKILKDEPANSTVVTHSSVLKAFKVWDEMGRPDVTKLSDEQKKDFATAYNKEETHNGDMETFKGDQGDIHVIRHGQTEDNAKNNFRSGDTNLTDKGVNDAKEAGNELGRKTGGEVPKIITSDLPRAVHTSNIIHGELDGDVPRNVPRGNVKENDNITSPHFEGERPVSHVGNDHAVVPDPEGEHIKHEIPFSDITPKEEPKAPEPENPEEKEISTKNRIADQIRGENGLPPVEIPADRTDDESLKAWKDGTRHPLEIIDQLLSGKDIYDKSITPNDEPIMREYIRGLVNRGMELNKALQSLSEKVKEGDEKAIADQASVKQQLLNHYDEMGRALDAERIGGNIWHKYGQERQIAVNEQGQLINSINRIKTIYGDDLPEAVKKELSDLQQKHDELVAKNQAIEERVKKLEAENELLKQNQKAKRGAKKTDQDFTRERKDILSDMRDALKDVRKKGFSTVVPGAPELAAIAPHVINLFKSFGEQGVLKLGEAVDKIHDLVKDVVEGITKDQVKDIVSGKYTAAEKLKKEGEAVQRKIDKGLGPKLKLPKRKWETDPEWIKNNREKANLMQKLRNMQQVAYDSSKSMYMRGLDWMNRWGRRVIFFGANAVYTKLSSAAVLGSFIHRPLEQLAGTINKKLFPYLAKGAPIEGNINMAAEAKFYKEFLNPIKFARNIWEQAKSGETPLSKELGKFSNKDHVPIIDLFAADVHAMIKDPVKRATFEAAVINHLNFYADNAIDGTHPLMLESARQAAYKAAEYEIFQNSSKNATGVKAFFNDLEKSGVANANLPDNWSKLKGNAQYTAAALYHFFVPVNTVPLNILKRVGLGLRTPVTMAEAMSKNKAIKEGILNMSQEDSDLLMRQLKKGQIGTAYWTLGFILGGSAIGGLYTKYDPDKGRKRGDPKINEMNLGGVDVSKDVQHNTQLQSMQMGGTWETVYSHFIDDKGASQMEALAKATAATAGAAIESIPTLNEGVKIAEAMKDPYMGKKFVTDLENRIGIGKAASVLSMMGYGNDEPTGGSGGGGGAGGSFKIKEYK